MVLASALMARKWETMVSTSSLFMVFGPALIWQYFLRPSSASMNSMSMPLVVEAKVFSTSLQKLCICVPKVVVMEVPSTRG